MKIPSMRHPESEELLRYVDGESPARAARQIRSHLEKCWECRVELEELQSTVGECVRYTGRHAQATPPPLRRRGPISIRNHAKIDAALIESSVHNRHRRCAGATRTFGDGHRWR